MSEPTHELPTPDPDLDVGQVIGEYQIEEKVGQGGFGTVYRAVHPLIGKVVAIKVLARKFSADPEMISRFIAEARSVNQIRHRHIIDIFLFGSLPDGRAYYVMEYLDGEALDALIDREKRLTLVQALPILRAIARALDAAHAKGITHRDLKPENVFLVRDADNNEVWPKLLDFGIAKLMGNEEAQKHKTRTGIPIGTPFYMSPEQCRGKDVDHRTDYYAFGIVAYQMLTGVHPIDADDYMEIMIKQLKDEPVAPSTLVPELPAEIDDAIAWLMKKSRDQRPPNLMTAMKMFDDIAERNGIAVPRATHAFDSVTPPPGLARPASVPNAGLAATMPSQIELEPPVRKSKLPWLIGAVAIVGAAIGVFAMTRGGEPAPVAAPVVPAPAPAPVATPTPAPAAVVAPAPEVAPVPAPAVDAKTKKPTKAKPTTKKPSHDDIIDVFGKDKP
ncbi:MAG TPA: serine/threonine-protein kinase [Kofleriaceae bacterium]